MIPLLPGFLYGPFAFAITFAENWVASRERGAERKSRTARTWRHSAFSANWSSVFEIILLVDILLTVAEPWMIAPWVIVGGWLGQFLACERQRRKFRRNAGKVANLRKRRTNDKVESTPSGGLSAAEAAGSTLQSAK